MKRLTFSEFVAQCGQKFESKFSGYKCTDDTDFSLKNSTVSFICPNHGQQTMNARLHRNSVTGCPVCSIEHRSKRQLIGHEKYL